MDYTNPKVLGAASGGTLAATGGVTYIAIAVGVAVLVILAAISIRKFHPVKK